MAVRRVVGLGRWARLSAALLAVFYAAAVGHETLLALASVEHHHGHGHGGHGHAHGHEHGHDQGEAPADAPAGEAPCALCVLASAAAPLISPVAVPAAPAFPSALLLPSFDDAPSNAAFAASRPLRGPPAVFLS